jgi:hypothetical protein
MCSNVVDWPAGSKDSRGSGVARFGASVEAAVPAADATLSPAMPDVVSVLAPSPPRSRSRRTAALHWFGAGVLAVGVPLLAIYFSLAGRGFERLTGWVHVDEQRAAARSLQLAHEAALLAAVQKERQLADGQVHALVRERDAALAQGHALVRERDAALAQVQALVRERDAVRAEAQARDVTHAAELASAHARVQEKDAALEALRAREETRVAELNTLLARERERSAAKTSPMTATGESLPTPAEQTTLLPPSTSPAAVSADGVTGVSAQPTAGFVPNPCKGPSAKFLSTCKE